MQEGFCWALTWGQWYHRRIWFVIHNTNKLHISNFYSILYNQGRRACCVFFYFFLKIETNLVTICSVLTRYLSSVGNFAAFVGGENQDNYDRIHEKTLEHNQLDHRKMMISLIQRIYIVTDCNLNIR